MFPVTVYIPKGRGRLQRSASASELAELGCIMAVNCMEFRGPNKGRETFAEMKGIA